jgi:hypothetical protein
LHAKKKIYVGLFIMLMKRKMLKGEIFKSWDVFFITIIL